MVAFTAGENYVTGNVINGVDPDFLADPGIIVFRGPGTKVVLRTILICGVGICDVGAGVTIDVLADHTFITAGELRINLNPINPSHITSAGDVGIAGKLTVNLSGFSPGSLCDRRLVRNHFVCRRYRRRGFDRSAAARGRLHRRRRCFRKSRCQTW